MKVRLTMDDEDGDDVDVEATTKEGEAVARREIARRAMEDAVERSIVVFGRWWWCGVAAVLWWVMY